MRSRAEGGRRSEAKRAAASKPVEAPEGQRQPRWVRRCHRTEAGSSHSTTSPPYECEAMARNATPQRQWIRHQVTSPSEVDPLPGRTTTPCGLNAESRCVPVCTGLQSRSPELSIALHWHSSYNELACTAFWGLRSIPQGCTSPRSCLSFLDGAA